MLFTAAISSHMLPVSSTTYVTFLGVTTRLSTQVRAGVLVRLAWVSVVGPFHGSMTLMFDPL